MTLLEPFAPLFELSREMERLLGSSAASRPFVPAADVVVTDDDVTVHMDVPGLTTDDISIELDGDMLTVRGERKPAHTSAEDGDGRVRQRNERGHGRFQRVLRVPEGLDPDAIEGSLADGVLTLRLPVPAARRPRRIEIATGDGQPALDEGANRAAGLEREPVGAAA
jgi:HSP20 family protein